MKTIPPFRLKPEPLNEAAKNLPKFKWAGDNIGTRHQLGGEPTYIQAKIHPVCMLSLIRSMTNSALQIVV